jgi:dihydrofolate reductase
MSDRLVAIRLQRITRSTELTDMRKLVLKISMSLDGFVGGPNGEIDWIFPTLDDGATEWLVAMLGQAGVHIMGRVTYGDMAAHWPTSNEPYAAPMNTIPKVVFSHTLSEANWSDSRVARGELSAEIAALKQQPGKEILAHGGARFVQSLAQQGLIDEYRLLIHPVVLGRGLRLFSEQQPRANLQLLSTKRFEKGLVANSYRPAPV